MNAIQVLLADHKNLKRLVAKAYKTKEKDREAREELFIAIYQAAKLHEKMEEKFLYSLLSTAAKARPSALEHTEEVALMERLLNQLNKLRVDDEKWMAKFKVFKELNDHHIEEEEQTKFPLAFKLLSKEDLEEVGEKMLAYKEKHTQEVIYED